MVANIFIHVTILCFILYTNITYLKATLNLDESCYKVNASECYYGGNYDCGTCTCDAEHFGKRCECLTNPSYLGNLEECRKPGSNSDCSAKGVCICGHCLCDIRQKAEEVIFGNWCECDNYSCLRHNGEICAGHGTCDCGICKCNPPWDGPACTCSNATNNCSN